MGRGAGRHAPRPQPGDAPVPRRQLPPGPPAVRPSGRGLWPTSLPRERPLWALAGEGSPLPCWRRSLNSPRLTCIPKSSQALQTRACGVQATSRRSRTTLRTGAETQRLVSGGRTQSLTAALLASTASLTRLRSLLPGSRSGAPSCSPVPVWAPTVSLSPHPARLSHLWTLDIPPCQPSLHLCLSVCLCLPLRLCLCVCLSLFLSLCLSF